MRSHVASHCVVAAGTAPALAYMTVARDPAGQDLADQLRAALRVRAAAEHLDLVGICVDHPGEGPYGFAVLTSLLRTRREVRTLLLPGLDHLGHVASVAHLSQAGVGRYLNVAVVVLEASAEGSAGSRPAGPALVYTSTSRRRA